jgi:PAS domain S-box-containing protein
LSAIDQTSEGIAIVDMDGCLLFINGAFAAMHGYEAEELLGKNLRTFHTPDQLEAVENALECARENGQFEGEIWHVHRDGTVFPSLMRNTLLRDESGEVVGMLGTIRDITEQKRAEKELRDTHEQLRATLDALPDLLFENDRQGRISYFHAPNMKKLYRTPKEFIGKLVHEVLPRDVADVIVAATQETFDTGSCPATTYSLDIGGQKMWFEMSMVAKGDLNSEHGRVVALVRDITDHKRSEKELKKMTSDLEAERQELLEKNIALEQILNHLEGQKKSFQRDVWHDVERSVMPLVKKLRQELEPGHSDEIVNLIAALEALLSESGDDVERRYGRLTSRESEICELIKKGMSSKQITDQLNLSLLTVHKHREQIRKKLGIVNLDVSLATFLRYH